MLTRPQVFVGLFLTAALAIGVWPALLILGEAASTHFEQRCERAVINQQMKDIAGSKDMRMLPDGFNPQLARITCRSKLLPGGPFAFAIQASPIPNQP